MEKSLIGDREKHPESAPLPVKHFFCSSEIQISGFFDETQYSNRPPRFTLDRFK
jgi:hypothetical protein